MHSYVKNKKEERLNSIKGKEGKTFINYDLSSFNNINFNNIIPNRLMRNLFFTEKTNLNSNPLSL